jgi:hypothetical protein
MGRPVAQPLKVWNSKKDDNGESMYQILTLKIDPRIPVRELKDALRYTLDTHCQHSYDCCGNWYRSVYTHTLRRAKRREWHVEVVWYKNV